jgi:hypothetical protein
MLSVASSLVGPNIVPNAMLSNTAFFAQVANQVSHPYTATGTVMYFSSYAID